ncbi:MAG: flagellar M-ring protein FliF [Rhodospirillaceae bacterium]|nr:flagellar M-ring protein FliF [Rhodospirillaceae bacterium]
MRLLEFFNNLGPTRIAAMAAAAILTLGFFIFIIGRVSSPDMSLLYSELDVKDSGQIVTILEQRNIPYEVRNNGSQIYIPSNNVQRIRLSLAQEGLPSGGSLGYEIFDRSDALGTTNFVQNVNLVRALEGELARTIRSFDTIEGARVHLVLPRRELFSRETRTPSASVIVKTRSNRRLEVSRVRAIQHLVASAVDGLSTSKISIVDDSGNLLAQSQESENGLASAATLEEARLETESRLRSNIERLIERTVGFGKVRAEVSVDMDFDRVTESDETFDPLGQVERSTQRITENSKEIEGSGDNTVTVANNLPETQAEENPAGPINSIETNRTEETINYEITKSTTTRIQESGNIERLTVAVLVDGIQKIDENGEITYTPRTKDELDKIASLVRTTVGYDQERGDQIEVINMQFASIDVPLQLTEATFMGLTKKDIFRIAEIVMFLIIGILIILFVLRPLISRAFSTVQTVTADETELEGIEGQEGVADGQLTADIEAQAQLKAQADEEALVSLGAVEGQLKSGTLDKIGELIDKHPDAAVSVLKGWVRED